MSRVKHLYGQQGNRWLPKDTGTPAELVAVECSCGCWLVPTNKIGAPCEKCGTPQKRRP